MRDYRIEPAPEWVRMDDGAVLFTIHGGVLTGKPTDVKVEPNPGYTIVFGNPATPDPLRIWMGRWFGAVSHTDLRRFADDFYEFIRSFADDL